MTCPVLFLAEDMSIMSRDKCLGLWSRSRMNLKASTGLTQVSLN